jgi:23S rRNA (adenine-N6)-dimethyltransferase
VRGAGVGHGDLVVDIGAGHGALTAALLRAGARVIAVELHPQRVEALRRRFAGLPVAVVRTDAADLRLPRRPFHVVANPPFASTAAILRRLTANGSRLVQADVVVPLHVARRLASAPGTGAWVPSVVCRVPDRAFTPPPPNPTAVLRLTATPNWRR